MKKRLLALLLTVAMVLSLLAFPAAAETETSGTCGENLTWKLDDGVLTISGAGDMANWSWGSDVPWYSNRELITSVVIADGITSIGKSAFSGCSNLISIMIPDGVTSIGYNAFKGCSSLTSITIPDTVTSIGAFEGCTSLTKIDVDSNNSIYCSVDGVLFSKEMTELICYPGGKMDQNYVIPDRIGSIDSYAFSDCSSLISITIPEGVRNVGNWAFSGCSSLVSITIPDSVTSIGSTAFSGCSSLITITIPDGVKSIGACTFAECTSLTSITIPNGITSIAYQVFRNCSSLISIEIPNSVTSIGEAAFWGCSSLTSIAIPDGVTSLDATFLGCTSLTGVTIPDSVTSIGRITFKNCSSLTSITIPDSVTSIGGAAFWGCSSLTKIDVDSNNTSYCSVDGVLFSKDMTRLIRYPGGKTDQNYSIPDGVTSIVSSAFSACSSLTSLEIPASVNGLGSACFMGMGTIEIYFKGDKPQFPYEINEAELWDKVFSTTGGSDSDTNGIAYYPAGNTTWTKALDELKNQTNGGKVQWLPYGDTTTDPDPTPTPDPELSPEPSPEPDPEPTITLFDDVQDSSSWYYTPVYWAVENHITSGTGNNQFSPNTICTRAQAVTFLYNDMGK